jgi:hypothetical protein
MEKSRMVAVHALANKELSEEDQSPESPESPGQPLPLLQQRESFLI